MTRRNPALAERLRAAREAAGLTLAAVASRLDVTTPTYHQYETGRRAPTLDFLHRAATAIGCDPHDLDARLQTNRPA